MKLRLPKKEKFVSFSSIIQLFDNGDIQQLEDINISDILPAIKQFFIVVFIQDLAKNKNSNLSEIRFIYKI